MRFFVAVILGLGFLFACGGDCASCHAKLDYQNDKHHAPMQDCKRCHTDEKMAQIDMGGCGQDCFACHNVQKLMSEKYQEEHKAIKGCIECHTKLQYFDSKNLFKKQPTPRKGNFLDNLSKEFKAN